MFSELSPEIQHSVVLLHLLWGGFGLGTFLFWLDKATGEEVVVKLLDQLEKGPNSQASQAAPKLVEINGMRIPNSEKKPLDFPTKIHPSPETIVFALNLLGCPDLTR